MTTSLSTLVIARSQQQILTDMFTAAESLGVDMVGVQSERLFRALFEIESTAKAQEEALRVMVTYGGFLDTAPLAGDAWVDLLAAGFFGLFRDPEVTTQGLLVLSATLLALGGNVAPNAVIAADANGVTFRNVEAFTIIPGQATNPVLFQAVQPGVSGNVPNNTITNMITTIGGVSINNPVSANGTWITRSGTPAENTSSLINRCRARWAATGYGVPASSYIQWVREAFVAEGLTSTVTRIGIDDTNPFGPGSTGLYLANASGPATSQELAIVDAYLQARRQTGSGPLMVLAAPAFNVPISATVYGITDNGTALTNLLALFSSITLGGIVRLTDIIVNLRDPKLPGSVDCLVTAPAIFDTPITTGHVPVATPINLSFVP